MKKFTPRGCYIPTVLKGLMSCPQTVRNMMENNMALVVISIDRDKLPLHTHEQFEEWVKFCVGHLGGISMDNPLHDIDMTASVRECGG